MLALYIRPMPCLLNNIINIIVHIVWNGTQTLASIMKHWRFKRLLILNKAIIHLFALINLILHYLSVLKFLKV